MVHELLLPFFTALGVIVGGALVGTLTVLFSGASPVMTVKQLIADLRLWAIVAAMGGTFPTIRAIESGLFGGQHAVIVRQLSVVISGFLGAQAGAWLLSRALGLR